METAEQKLARLEAENKALRTEATAQEASIPNSVTVEFSVGGKAIAVGEATKRTFSSGSRGFYGSSKLSIAGLRYQVNVQLVEIGSKPAAAKKAA